MDDRHKIEQNEATTMKPSTRFVLSTSTPAQPGIKTPLTDGLFTLINYSLLLSLFIVSCDLGGDVFITNGYRDTVKVISQCDYRGSIIESNDILHEGEVFAFDTRRPEYKNIISIKIETLDGTQIAEYSPDYLVRLRKAYGKKTMQQESWIFTEKGLFFKTEKILKRYKFDSEKIMDYYRSDEAVTEQESRLLLNSSQLDKQE